MIYIKERFIHHVDVGIIKQDIEPTFLSNTSFIIYSDIIAKD